MEWAGDLAQMKWLIVEDALRDRKGHWLEYVSTFVRELRALGDEVLGNNVKKDFRKTRACLLGIYSSMFFLNDLLFLEVFVWIFV